MSELYSQLYVAICYCDAVSASSLAAAECTASKAAVHDQYMIQYTLFDKAAYNMV
jgi:hypothetical protein